MAQAQLGRQVRLGGAGLGARPGRLRRKLDADLGVFLGVVRTVCARRAGARALHRLHADTVVGRETGARV